jgi:GTP-binding protein
MFERINFIKSAYKPDELPASDLPQLILCGRSNVGKSTFINSLFNRKNLAKTSSTPGKTRSINFYNIDEVFLIVDLPGFGYAKTSYAERGKWNKLLSEYILTSKNIHHAFHVIDSRHRPTELDIRLKHWLENANKNYSVILNKVDKLKQSEVNKSVKELLFAFPELQLNKDVFLYSAFQGKWKKPILKKLAELFY